MNFALPAIVLFVLLFPGFVARSRLKLVEKKSVDYSPFGQVVMEAVAWAAFMHLIWITGMEWCGLGEFSSEIVFGLLSSHAGLQSKALQSVAAEQRYITWYFGTILTAAYSVPLVIRWMISKYRWDRVDAQLSGLFRFSAAPWYYLLSGADFKESEEPDLIGISAVVDIGGNPYLFTGFLDEYFLDLDGKLDRLVLAQAMRRPFDKDKSSNSHSNKEDRFYKIDGDYFVLRYCEIITLNVQYIKLQLNDGAQDA